MKKLLGALNRFRTGQQESPPESHGPWKRTKVEGGTVAADMDLELRLASKKAQNSLATALAALEEPETIVMVKVEFPVADHEISSEHVWFTDIKIVSEFELEGELSGNPQKLPEMVVGSRYRFSKSAVSDWGINRFDGKIEGLFTKQVLDKLSN